MDTSDRAMLGNYSETVQMICHVVRENVVDIQGRKRGGSGIIISADGYILTNAHVILKEQEPTITLSDGKRFVAEMIGKDELTDISVLKIPARSLKPAAIGDSSDCKTGELVVAVGSPVGLQGTVTAGIVSSTGRAIMLEDETVIYSSIQTDAAINPGNSGGPLVNSQGKVIGVNYSKLLDSEGISFAIPINTAVNIANKIIKDGEVKRADIGLRIFYDYPLPADVKRKHKIRTDTGVRIEDFVVRWQETPAEKAGIRAGRNGDIIISIDGKLMTTSELIDRFFTECQPGKVITLTLLRDYQVIVRKKVKTDLRK